MNRRKPVFRPAVFATITILLWGWGGYRSASAAAPADTGVPAEKRTLVDAAGNRVEVPARLKKLGVTPIPWASVIDALDGSSTRLAAVHPSAMKAYEHSLLKKIDPDFGRIPTRSIGSDFSINMEEMLNLGVEVMVIWDHQDGEAAQLARVGIAPVMLKNKTMEELQESFRIAGRLLGQEERAQRFIDAYESTYAAMAARADALQRKPRVLYLRDAALKVQGNDNFMRQVLELAGADNIAARATEAVTMEEVLAWDPEIIFLSNFDAFVPEDFYANTFAGQDWSHVSAVVNRRVYKTPLGIYRWDAPGIETPLMMLWLGMMIQPEVFPESAFKEALLAFYKTHFDYTLSDEDIAELTRRDANEMSRH